MWVRCKNIFLHLCFLLCFVFLLFAEHFALQNVMLNIFLWKMWCWTFSLWKMWCVALQKCIFATHQMHFCNAPTKCTHLCFLQSKKHSILPLSNILVCFAKMHLMQKCIFAYILRSKMFSITFCFAEHFPLENVRKNAFLHQMHFCINKMLQMHFGNAYILLCKMFSITFSKGKCSASNAFWRTFDFVKCSASHFPKENVQQSNAQHQIHFCKCCAWAAKTSKAKNNLVSQTILFFVNKALR